MGIGVELEKERGETLLTLIINEWITRHGFSFARGLMELYELANKQSLQKAKDCRQSCVARKRKWKRIKTQVSLRRIRRKASY